MNKQAGFTLIEIIAVLVILGILAAVAIPKYQDLQETAREKALDGALAAAGSQLTMAYSNELLKANGVEANIAVGNITSSCAGIQGDFTITCGGGLGAFTAEATDPNDGTIKKTKTFAIGSAAPSP